MSDLFGGMRVVVSPLLPLPVSPGEEARRIVRHGMADILEWLGEPVGPSPEERTHAILGVDPGAPQHAAPGIAFVSAELEARLRAQAEPERRTTHPLLQLPIATDDMLPPNVAELRDGAGAVVGHIHFDEETS